MSNRERPLRAVFVTYSFAPSAGQSAIIGVLKRFLRLVRYLPPEAVEVHWLHGGYLPEHDPMVREWLPRLNRYAPSGECLNAPGAWLRPRLGRLRWRVGKAWHPPGRSEKPRLTRLFSKLRPDLVVLMESPLAGFLLEASEVAQELGLPQVAMDNYMEPGHPDELIRGSPQIERWFLLGLPYRGERGWQGERILLAPPLLAPSPGPASERADVTILGYDPKVGEDGVTLAGLLPAGTVARLLGPPLPEEVRERYRRQAGGARLLFAPMPDEADYRASLEGSSLVVCKNGFQQIVECLAVGTPVIVSEGSGVPGCFLSEEILRFTRYLPPDQGLWDDAVGLARGWMSERPAMPWTSALAGIPDMARHSAGLFLEFLERSAAEPLTARGRTA
ncbi:MAG: hypothetical protein ABUT39_06060 [Acidobacteriota bacterium]